MDMDELQCVLANLIAKKWVRAYISHKHQKVVTAKTNVFPKLSSFA
jgi:hypothetical protein